MNLIHSLPVIWFASCQVPHRRHARREHHRLPTRPSRARRGPDGPAEARFFALFQNVCYIDSAASCAFVSSRPEVSLQANFCKFPPLLRRPWLEIGDSVCPTINERRACNGQSMSRPESPEPCYDHPECAPKRGAPYVVSAPTSPWRVPVLAPGPVAPLAPIGLFLRFHGNHSKQ